jgi:DNA-directed RNA polymerase subunit omega
VFPEELRESLTVSMQKVQMDDDDAADEVGSLSLSAEALRLTASAPARTSNLGGDFDA